MDENNDIKVLCAASAYDRKFYLNDAYYKLPGKIKDELKILCVLFTEDVGGIIVMKFDEEGTLYINTEADCEDITYDEIGAALKVRHMQAENRELFEQLEAFYKFIILGEEE